MSSEAEQSGGISLWLHRLPGMIKNEEGLIRISTLVENPASSIAGHINISLKSIN